MNLNALKSTGKWLVLIAISIVLTAGSCRKEVEPPELPVPPTKWEVISGTYKVYDTTGVYLYEMKITHSWNEGANQDILFFENFDGQFEFSAIQSNHSEFWIKYGHQQLLYDDGGKRWKIIHSFDDIYDNILRNDTIKMVFRKTNINYYLSDLTPYYACDCKQVAVKQH